MAKRTRDKEGVSRRYIWRLYPTPEQRSRLVEQAAMCADLWNVLLDLCERMREFRVWYYTQQGPAFFDIHGDLRVLRLSEVWMRRRVYGARIRVSDILISRAERVDLPPDAQRRFLPSEFDMGYWVSEMLAECPEWRALSTWTPRRVVTSLAAAWQAFFRRLKAGEIPAGYPQYKSRRDAVAIPHRCASGCKIIKSDEHKTSWLLRLKGIDDQIHARGGARHHGIENFEESINEWTDADVRLIHRGWRDNHCDDVWEISIAVNIDERRQSYGKPRPVLVDFNLVDGFVSIDGEPVTPWALIDVKVLDANRALMQAAFDLRWPRGQPCTEEERQERREQHDEINRLASRIARIRRNALHVLTCQIVEGASLLKIRAPRVKENTQTPRGDAKDWGAAVKPVSSLNRNTLSYAPAMAVQMLEYKAKELGIPCEVIEDIAPEIAIGAKLVSANKATRKLNRAIRRVAQ